MNSNVTHLLTDLIFLYSEFVSPANPFLNNAYLVDGDVLRLDGRPRFMLLGQGGVKKEVAQLRGPICLWTNTSWEAHLKSTLLLVALSKSRRNLSRVLVPESVLLDVDWRVFYRDLRSDVTSSDLQFAEQFQKLLCMSGSDPQQAEPFWHDCSADSYLSSGLRRGFQQLARQQAGEVFASPLDLTILRRAVEAGEVSVAVILAGLMEDFQDLPQSILLRRICSLINAGVLDCSDRSVSNRSRLTSTALALKVVSGVVPWTAPEMILGGWVC